MKNSRTSFSYSPVATALGCTLALGLSLPRNAAAATCALPVPGAPACYYVDQLQIDTLASQVQNRSGVRIASVSSGIDFSVPSLSAAVVRNQGEMGQGREDNGVDDDANGYVDDAYGYDVLREYKSPRDSRLALGTYAASMWVGEQRRGFASDSRPLLFRGFVRGAGLIPVRVVNETGLTSLEATMQGIRYAAARGARIIHLEVTLQTAAGQPLCDVIREVGLRGSLVVAPAGNRGLEVGPRDFPAACAILGLNDSAPSKGRAKPAARRPKKDPNRRKSPGARPSGIGSMWHQPASRPLDPRPGAPLCLFAFPKHPWPHQREIR